MQSIFSSSHDERIKSPFYCRFSAAMEMKSLLGVSKSKTEKIGSNYDAAENVQTVVLRDC